MKMPLYEKFRLHAFFIEWGRGTNYVMMMSYSLCQSAIQDVDYENELDLLYAVVTLRDPSREGSMAASLFFVHDKTGDLLKKVPLPTWKPVS